MTMAATRIFEAESEADFAAFGGICRAYTKWCRDCYTDMGWFVAEVFGHQSLDAELANLAAKYCPPQGRTLLVEMGGAVIAGGAYRRFSEELCELKRLFVTDAAQGGGIGRRLTEALIVAAREDGFTTMILDTGDRLTAAIALYGTLGFERVPPFHDYPPHLLPYLVFMRRRIDGQAESGATDD